MNFIINKYPVKILLILLLATFAASGLKAQHHEYDIVIWLGKIGKLHISQEQQDSLITIETNSEVKIPFYKINWITTVKLEEDGKYLESHYRQLLNGKRREFTEIKPFNDSLMQVVDDQGRASQIQIRTPFYVSKLYFEEPVGEEYIFSERFAKPLKLVKKGEGHYRLLLPDDNYIDYFYENGFCKMAEAINGHKTVKLVYVENVKNN